MPRCTVLDRFVSRPQTTWRMPSSRVLAPVTLQDNRLYYVDNPVTNHPRRFYRAVPQ
jgi:hypothetical protein